MEYKRGYYLIGMLVVLIIHTVLLNVWLNNEPPGSKRVQEGHLKKHPISKTLKHHLSNRDSVALAEEKFSHEFSVALK